MDYRVEMDKLAAGLTGKGIPFTYKPLFDGVQIMGSVVQSDDGDVEG